MTIKLLNGIKYYVKIRRKLVLLIITCGVTMLYFNSYHVTWGSLQKGNSVGFVVNTPGCRIPDLPTFGHDIEPYVRNQYADPKCSEKWYDISKSKKQRGPPLVQSNLTAMWVVRSAFQYYNIKDLSQFNCCYKPFWRAQENPNNYSRNADNNIRYANNCEPFHGESFLVDKTIEFVLVECKRLSANYESLVPNTTLVIESEDLLVYKDFHAFVPLKDKVEERCLSMSHSRDKLSVLVVGLDSMSRINMLRQLPRTHRVLMSPSFSAISLLGYNKVGDNTFPNLIPLLTGCTEEELVSICWPTRHSKMDDCPFIWKKFADKGYRTAYGEDSTTISTFNYKKVGFVEQPTDYYVRPFFSESLQQLGHVGKTLLKLCTGPRPSFDNFLDYIKKFAVRFSSEPYFAFFWSNIISHSNLNMPHIGDAQLAGLLEELQSSGALNRSVLVLMSDHGIRWGKFRETYQGRLEERLPFFMISFPKWFHTLYPDVMKNLQKNAQKRLTTPFDVHKTLVELLQPNRMINSTSVPLHNIISLQTVINNNTYDNNAINYTERASRGISLFLPISESRTCEDAGILSHWCTCQANGTISSSLTEVRHAANFIIITLNQIVSFYSDCENLQLKEIKYAEEKNNYKIEKQGILNNILDYLIVLTTSPGGAIFEATVRQTLKLNSVNAHFTLAGPISRLNSYVNQSSCVNDSTIKLYCYCKTP